MRMVLCGLVVVVLLAAPLAQAGVPEFKTYTRTAAEDLEVLFVQLGQGVISLAKAAGNKHASLTKAEIAQTNARDSLLDLSVRTDQAGCDPYAVDMSADRVSELAIISDDVWSEPDPSVVAWADGDNDTCFCRALSDAWNATVVAAGLSMSSPCERVCDMERFIRVSASLDPMIVAMQDSMLSIVSAWYYTTLNQIRVWIPPIWSLASMNITFQDMIGCTPNPLYWVSWKDDGLANWTLPPYTDMITGLPMVTVAAAAHTPDGERIGAMFVDITLPSVQMVFDNVKMPIVGALMLLISHDGSVITCPPTTFDALFGGQETPNFNLAQDYPELVMIANGTSLAVDSTNTVYEQLRFNGTIYVAVGTPFASLDCIFVVMAPKSNVIKDNSLVIGLAVGIPGPIIITILVVMGGLTFYTFRLKRRVASLQNELVTVKASDLIGTPADDAIKALLAIKDRKRLRDEDRQQLSRIVSLIACNKLYKADYSTRKRHGVAVDKDIDAYLVDQLVRPDSDDAHKPARETTFRSKSGNLKLVTPRAREVLRGLDHWDFDVTAIPTNTLQVVGVAVLESKGLLEFFEIEKPRLEAFLQELSKGYHEENPYHSSVHAADVTQAMHCLLAASTAPFTELEQLAALIAAMIHDYRHPGVNNNFLVNSRDMLAMRYNCVSVLENMHASEGMLLLAERANNFLEHLPQEMIVELYNIVVGMVLSTDMARHIEITSQFAAIVNSSELDLTTKNHRVLLLKMFMKFADISNPTRPWEVCYRWSQRVMAEFFQQGDQERNLGLPISPFMDRNSTSVPKCQSAFCEFVVIPTTELIAKVVPSIESVVLGNARANLLKWKESLAATPSVAPAAEPSLLDSSRTETV